MSPFIATMVARSRQAFTPNGEFVNRSSDVDPDPDPHRSASILVGWIRIRIQQSKINQDFTIFICSNENVKMVRYPCIIVNFTIWTNKNSEILVYFALLDPDPDPADQNRRGSVRIRIRIHITDYRNRTVTHKVHYSIDTRYLPTWYCMVPTSS